MPSKNNHRIIISLFIATGLVLALIIAVIPIMGKTDNIALLLDSNPPQKSDSQPDPFNSIAISAKAAIVLDPKTGEVIYSKNSNQAMPLASITKIMTALVAEELIPNPDNTIVTITKEDLKPEGDSGLVVGQTWKLKDLINFSLISSSNDGIHAVARTASEIAHTDFIETMNRKARELHLTQTTFSNESGLDINTSEVGASGSAENIAQLFAYVTNNKPELIEATKNKNTAVAGEKNHTRMIANTNEAIDQIPSLLASKTGYTDLSGGNLAVVFDRGLGQKAIVVVLGSTQENRFSDVVTLAKAASDKLQLELNENK